MLHPDLSRAIALDFFLIITQSIFSHELTVYLRSPLAYTARPIVFHAAAASMATDGVPMDRRSFLKNAALVGSALSFDPDQTFAGFIASA